MAKSPNKLKALVVTVKKRHIEQAKPGSFTCPIALALNEKFPDYSFQVGLRNIKVFRADDAQEILRYMSLACFVVSKPARKEIIFFDRYDKVDKMLNRTFRFRKGYLKLADLERYCQ